MQPLKTKKKRGPEAIIQDAIMSYLRAREWFVKSTHGNLYMSGFPDLYAMHHKYKSRWIEVKLPKMKGSKFTPAQLRDFPQFSSHGVGIWILTAATEHEYEKLFGPPNWYLYLDMMRGSV